MMTKEKIAKFLFIHIADNIDLYNKCVWHEILANEFHIFSEFGIAYSMRILCSSF